MFCGFSKAEARAIWKVWIESEVDKKGARKRNKELSGNAEGGLFIRLMVWAFDVGIDKVIAEEQIAELKREGALVGNRAETPFVGVSCVGPDHAHPRPFEAIRNLPTRGPDTAKKPRPQPRPQSEPQLVIEPQTSESSSESENEEDQKDDGEPEGVPGPFQERDMDTSEHIVSKMCALWEMQKSSLLRSTLIKRHQHSQKFKWFGRSGPARDAHDWRAFDMARRL